MTDNKYGLKEDLTLLKDDELRKIVYLESSDYEQNAIDRAKNELFNRECGRIWGSNNIIFRDLFKYSNNDDVISSFLSLFPEENDKINEYHRLLDDLVIETKNPKDEPDSDIYIFIDDQNQSFSNKNWNVFGKQHSTNEIICLDYIYKKEWLNFRVLKEQLQRLGIERYIAYCLREMTAVGFSDEEIDGKFYSVEKQDSIKNLQSLYPTMTDDKSGVFIMDVLPSAKQFVTSKEDLNNYTDISQIRPWVRFFARTIDYTIWIYSLEYLFLFLFPNIYIYAFSQNIILRFLASTLLYILWMFVEAFLLSKYGYTLGKWILKVRVTDKYGQKLTYINALKRAFGVFIFGTALEIPVLTMLASIISYTKLNENGITKWDRNAEIKVIHSEYSTLDAIITAIILLLPTIITILFTYLN